MANSMPAMWVRSLGQADPLEKEMATHSNRLAGKIPWTEEPGRLQSMGLQRVRHDWATNTSGYRKTIVWLLGYVDFLTYESFSKSLSLSDLSIPCSFNHWCIHSSSMACYSSWGHKELDTTLWLHNNNQLSTWFFTVVPNTYVSSLEGVLHSKCYEDSQYVLPS